MSSLSNLAKTLERKNKPSSMFERTPLSKNFIEKFPVISVDLMHKRQGWKYQQGETAKFQKNGMNLPLTQHGGLHSLEELLDPTRCCYPGCDGRDPETLIQCGRKTCGHYGCPAHCGWRRHSGRFQCHHCDF